MDKCKHVWMMKAQKVYADNAPHFLEARVIMYCPLCKTELSTHWTKLSIKRENVEPNNSKAVDW